MGFYGNITNTARTSFQFDLIYPSRADMDNRANGDNVYVGRFVLVEYDKNYLDGNYILMYKKTTHEGKTTFGLTLNTNKQPTGVIKIGKLGNNSVPNNTFLRVPGGTKDGSNNYYNRTYSFIRLTKDTYEKRKYYTYNAQTDYTLATGNFDPNATYYEVNYGAGDEIYIATGQNGANATISLIVEGTENKSNYLINYNKDVKAYGPSRGYDSTVWQKVYKEGINKYVMVAELNTVVPTFDIGADAPSVTPMIPHFDTNSTNVYYKLHWQPTWGFRPRPADGLMAGHRLDDNGRPLSGDVGFHYTTTLKKSPSDVSVPWYNYVYDTSNDSTIQQFLAYNKTGDDSHEGLWQNVIGDNGEAATVTGVPAAIYFNKAGFDSGTITYSGDKKYQGWKDEKVIDNITVEPTGLSGHSYNSHDGTLGTSVKEDIQELEIMLPSLGDSVAHMWDLVYGGRDTSVAIKENNKRNKNINWEDSSAVVQRPGLRMVKEDDETYAYDNTKGDNKYNKAAVNTLAGCINSVHDLMGMIISPRSGVASLGDPTGLDDNMIYYDKQSKEYYRKHLSYTYKDLPFTSEYYTMEQVDVDAANYVAGMYYTSTTSGSAVSPANCSIYTGAYDINKTYYIKKLNTVADYVKVTPSSGLLDFTKGDYYYADTNGDSSVNKESLMDFIKDKEYHKGKTYYTINPGAQIKLSSDYKKDTYFYKTTNGNIRYKLDTNENFTAGRTYYKLTDIERVKSESGSSKIDGIYTKSKFYYKALDDEKKTPSTDINNPGGSKKTVYVLDTTERGTGIPNHNTVLHYAITEDHTDTGQKIFTQVEDYKLAEVNSQAELAKGIYYTKDSDGTFSRAYTYAANTPYYERTLVYKEVSGFTISDTPLVLVIFEDNKFYIKEAIDPAVGLDPNKCNYKCIKYADIDPTNNTEYYTLKATAIDNYYKSYLYHYRIKDTSDPHNGSYILDRQLDMERDPSKVDCYFDLQKAGRITKVTKEFFEPNEYYDKNGNLLYYKPANDEFFKKNDLFVTSDTLDVYKKGAAWSKDVRGVPASVQVGTREKKYEVVPIKEFAQSLNTIHGLILAINKILERDDTLTRDNTQVQGVINQMNDIIVRIDKLIPKQFLVVDAYGRIHSANYNTSQKSTASVAKETNNDNGIKGDVFAKASDINSMKDQWITAYINDNPSKPSVVFRHNFQPVNDSSNSTNKNGNGDTISLYTPKVDKMGHVVGKHIETITLPYGFKTIKSNGRGSGIVDNTSMVTCADIVADNTQDVLTINSGNKWLRIDTDAGSDTITLSHDIHAFSSGAANTDYGLTANKSITDLDTDNTFTVPVFAFDQAGHITKAENHTITIPEVFTKIVTTTSGVDNTDSTAGAAGTQVADSLQDTLTIAEGNKWINIAASNNAADDKITISHYAKYFTETTGSLDFNGNNENTFTIQSIGWDRAGHITSSIKNTFTLPNGFSDVKIVSAGSNETAVGAAQSGTLSASSIKDGFTFNVGNKWLVINTDVQNKAITIYHNSADTKASNSSESDAQIPKFGATFKIPTFKYDAMGHVFNVTTTTVTIPNITLTDGSGNVMTGLSYSDGKFTNSKANVGTLAITGYAKATANSALAATDSINSAFGKLEYKIDDEITNRTNAINSLSFDGVTCGNKEVIGNIKQTNGKIEVTKKTLTLNDVSFVLDNLNVTVTDDDIKNKFVRKVTETKGKIDVIYGVIEKEDLPTLEKNDIPELDYLDPAKSYEISIDEEVKNPDTSETTTTAVKYKFTYEELLAKVVELEKRVKALEPESGDANGENKAEPSGGADQDSTGA